LGKKHTKTTPEGVECERATGETWGKTQNNPEGVGASMMPKPTVSPFQAKVSRS